MKRILPTIISGVLFILALIFFNQTLIEIFQNDSKALTDYIIINATGAIFMLVLFIYINTGYRRSNRKLKDRLDAWANLSMYVRQAGDEVFTELPVGILLYDEELEIKWNNMQMLEIFNSKDLLDEKINDLSVDLNNLIKKKNTRGTISVGEYKYDVIIRLDSRIVYLFDVTEREVVQKRYLDHLPVMGIVSFDNLEESFVNLDVSEQSSIKGEYLSAIDDWLTKYDGYLRPFSEDSLIFFTHKKHLESMIVDKFDILDTIRNISEEHQLRITLSMGIAAWEANYDDLGIYAQSAIDLAEKRGGDQVVVNIENEKTNGLKHH